MAGGPLAEGDLREAGELIDEGDRAEGDRTGVRHGEGVLHRVSGVAVGTGRELRRLLQVDLSAVLVHDLHQRLPERVEPADVVVAALDRS